MHPRFEEADRLSKEMIGAAIEVHRIMGPGLLESIYESCLLHELQLRGIPAVNQRSVEVRYKDFTFEEEMRFDVLANDCLLVEVKAVKEIVPINKAQLLSYMKLLNIPIGLLINFHEPKLIDGVCRLILRDANRE